MKCAMFSADNQIRWKCLPYSIQKCLGVSLFEIFRLVYSIISSYSVEQNACVCFGLFALVEAAAGCCQDYMSSSWYDTRSPGHDSQHVQQRVSCLTYSCSRLPVIQLLAVAKLSQHIKEFGMDAVLADFHTGMNSLACGIALPGLEPLLLL